jgi:RNA binding exosome subunit
MSPGIDSVVKEICQKLSNVETKLTKLDKIEERLESMGTLYLQFSMYFQENP